MHSPHITTIAFFLLPILPLAQEGPGFLSVQDSLDFSRFMERAKPNDRAAVFAVPDDYRMVWHEKREGGFWMVMRGDGRSLADFLADPPQGFFPYGGGPSAHGPRGMLVVLDLPTGLIRQDRWYFEVP